MSYGAIRTKAAILLFCLARLGGLAAQPVSGALAGVWENASRFVEFSPSSGMRIVLKPYYGFVYEDTGWIPASVRAQNTASRESSPGIYDISVRYSGERKEALVPAALLGEGLWFRFFTRIGEAPAADVSAGNSVPEEDAAGTESEAEAGSAALAQRLAGFWRAAGAADAMRLYRSEAAPEFYTYYFTGNRYRRIRYWATDARKREIMAHFPGDDGLAVPIPKFLEIAGTLYTCVTGTGKVLRNYESGSWTLSGGKMEFQPDSVVYPGTAAEYRKGAAVTLTSDGTVLAFGEPWLKKTAITDLDADIAAHNGKTRPPREPLLEFMDLDFRWEDIERIRNHGMEP